MGLGRVENGLRRRKAPSFPPQGDPSRQGLSRGVLAQRAARYLAPGAGHAERQLLQQVPGRLLEVPPLNLQ